MKKFQPKFSHVAPNDRASFYPSSTLRTSGLQYWPHREDQHKQHDFHPPPGSKKKQAIISLHFAPNNLTIWSRMGWIWLDSDFMRFESQRNHQWNQAIQMMVWKEFMLFFRVEISLFCFKRLNQFGYYLGKPAQVFQVFLEEGNDLFIIDFPVHMHQ